MRGEKKIRVLSQNHHVGDKCKETKWTFFDNPSVSQDIEAKGNGIFRRGYQIVTYVFLS